VNVLPVWMRGIPLKANYRFRKDAAADFKARTVEAG
jgi:hypothetical protein